MQITIESKNQVPEAVKFLDGMNRVFIKPRGIQHFYTATRCEHCNGKAEEGGAIDIGCTTKAAANAFADAMRGQEIYLAKKEPLELGHNEETGLAVCTACDNHLRAEAVDLAPVEDLPLLSVPPLTANS